MANIVAQYLFDEDTGTILHDSSGNGLDGTFGAGASAPTWVGSGGGLQFDGIDDFITVPDNALFHLNANTIEALVYWEGGNGGIFDKTNAGATNACYQLMTEFAFGNQQFIYRVRRAGNVDNPSAPQTVPAIFHVIGGYDGVNTTHLFYPGVDNVIGGVGTPIGNHNGDCIIGMLGSGVYPFKGIMYKLVIYDDLLPGHEVDELLGIRNSGLRTEVEYTSGDVINSGLRTEVEWTEGEVRNSGLRTVVDWTEGQAIVSGLRTIWEYDLTGVTPPPPDTGLEPPAVPFCPTNLGQGPPVQRECVVTIPGGASVPSGPQTYGVGFRLYRKDCEIRIKQWGSNESYSIEKPFGGESFERGAEI